MKDEFDLEEMARAKILYLNGMPPTQLAESIGIPQSTLNKWAREGGWQEERQRVLAIISNSMIASLVEDHRKIWNDLQTIQQKAIDPIDKNIVQPASFREASQAYFGAIGELNRMKTGMLSINFLSDIAQVLKEEIQDRELLSKIAVRMRMVFEKYEKMTLSPNIDNAEV